MHQEQVFFMRVTNYPRNAANPRRSSRVLKWRYVCRKVLYSYGRRAHVLERLATFIVPRMQQRTVASLIQRLRYWSWKRCTACLGCFYHQALMNKRFSGMRYAWYCSFIRKFCFHVLCYSLIMMLNWSAYDWWIKKFEKSWNFRVKGWMNRTRIPHPHPFTRHSTPPPQRHPQNTVKYRT